MGTRWKRRSAPAAPEVVENLKKDCGVETQTAELLAARGFWEPQAAQAYLHPRLKDLHRPEQIKDMEQAVSRILTAVNNREKITVYADYDADGTTAAAILMLYLKKAGADIDYYIPNRLKEGYGMNTAALERIRARGTTLVITVDNGISALKEARRAAELGMDLIITDHHEPQETLPEAAAVLDNKRADSDYPFDELCGAGVAFKVVCALERKLKTGADLMAYLQMAAVATVADIVPLRGENRTIAKIGIESMNKSVINPGLAALVKKADIEAVTAGHIGYRIGPMINAPGRLGEADKVMALYLSENPVFIQAQAEHLYAENKERQCIENEILNDALAIVEKEKRYEDDILIAAGQGWHSGVVGIVASRLQERWHKPVIVIGFDENGIGRGSCRSVSGFNIFEALKSTAQVFENYGGHEQAAGFSIKKENLQALRDNLSRYAAALPMLEICTKRLYYDLSVPVSEITLETVRALRLFEPCGVGNPAPVFEVPVRSLTDCRLLGQDGQHLSFRADGMRCIGFNLARRYPQGPGQNVCLLAKPEINCYNNTDTIQLNLKDIKANPFKVYAAAEHVIRTCAGPADFKARLAPFGRVPKLERGYLKKLYSLIKRAGARGFGSGGFLNQPGGMLMVAGGLEILKEAGLITVEETGDVIHARILACTGKKDLTTTKTWQLLEAAAEH